MASTARRKKTPKTPTPETRTPRPKAARASAKRGATAAKPRPKVAPSLAVVKVAEALPKTVREVSYVSRAVDVLAERERKTDRVNQKAWRDLGAIAEDVRVDLRKSAERRVDAWTARAKKTKVGRRVARVPETWDRRVDAWLDRVGLVRKSRLKTAG